MVEIGFGSLAVLLFRFDRFDPILFRFDRPGRKALIIYVTSVGTRGRPENSRPLLQHRNCSKTGSTIRLVVWGGQTRSVKEPVSEKGGEGKLQIN